MYIVNTTNAPLDHLKHVFVPMEMCRRLPPPPIPPWLRNTPNVLRHLVANCSSWKKYTDFCSMQIPSEYPQALSDFGSDTVVSQWTAFITALLIGAVIVISVGITYFLYQTNRLKLDFFDEYDKHGRKSQIFRDQRCMTPSISETTQLSVCALDDDRYWGISPAKVIVDDLVHRKSHRGTTSAVSDCNSLYTPHWHNSEEIILLPERLMEDNIQSPFYVTSLSGSECPASHSLPIDSDYEKLVTSTKQLETVDSTFGSWHEHGRSYVQFHRENPLQKYYACLNRHLKKHGNLKQSNYGKMAGFKGVVQRCQKAGVSLIHRTAFWNRSTDHAPTEKAKFVPTLAKLRQSIYKNHTRYQFRQTFKRLQSLKSSNETFQITGSETVSQACSSTSTESSAPVNSAGKDVCNSTQHPAVSRLTHVGHLLCYGHNGTSDRNQSTRHNQTEHKEVPTYTDVNKVFVGHHGTNIKLKRHAFRTMKMPNVLRKIRKRTQQIDFYTSN